MHLDVPTLIFAGSFVSLVGAAVLLGARVTMGRQSSLSWWAGYALCFGVGAGCIAFGVTQNWVGLTFVGGFLNTASTALIWAGARAFQRRPVPAHTVFLALAIWALIDIACGAGGFSQIAMLSGFVVATALLGAVEYELWHGRAERLLARTGLAALIALHMLVLLGGVYDTLSSSLTVGNAPELNSWFGLIHFEALVFSIGAPVLMVTMCRERLTLDFKHASQIDPLTGIANRRTLFENAERLLEQCRARGVAFSVIEFDLDAFKAINDTHGHAVGDAVLAAFADTARSVLRPTDFFGRHGGEEFAVVLPGTNLAAAYAIAERARHAFTEAGRDVDGRQVFATVSAGIAEARPAQTFDELLEAADRALYRAKRNGRNRVERAEGEPTATDSVVIRVA